MHIYMVRQLDSVSPTNMCTYVIKGAVLLHKKDNMLDILERAASRGDGCCSKCQGYRGLESHDEHSILLKKTHGRDLACSSQ